MSHQPKKKDLQKVRLETNAKYSKFFTASGDPEPQYFKRRRCPACSSNGEANAKFKNDSGFIFVQCQSCGMIFINPALRQEIVEDIYLRSRETSGKARQWEKLVKHLKPAQQKSESERFRLLLKHTNRGLLLDFGCGFGKLTDKLKFYFDTVEGLEIDEFCALHAQRIFGFKVYMDFIENLDFLEKYDAVMSYNNIEHLYNPKKELNFINRSLKRGGILFIECPNVNSMSVRLFRGKHHLLQSNEHLNMFSYDTMRNILENAGFYIVEMRTRKLDIDFNDLFYFLFNRKKFFHRCSDNIFGDNFMSEHIVKYINLVTNFIFNKSIDILSHCQGAYLQVVARKT